MLNDGLIRELLASKVRAERGEVVDVTDMTPEERHVVMFGDDDEKRAEIKVCHL